MKVAAFLAVGFGLILAPLCWFLIVHGYFPRSIAEFFTFLF